MRAVKESERVQKLKFCQSTSEGTCFEITFDELDYRDRL